MSRNWILLSFCLIHAFHHSIAAKTPEPDEPWPHGEQSPDELEEFLIKFRNDLDKFVGLEFQAECNIDSDAYKAYNKLSEKMQIRPSDPGYYDKFDLLDATMPLNQWNKAYTLLKNELEKSKRTKVRLFCPITKGMKCAEDPNDKKVKCVCRTDFKPPVALPPNTTAKVESYHNATMGVCYLRRRSHCNVEWETTCASPSVCLVEKDDKVQPEKNLLCTDLNLLKYNLPDSSTCFCDLNTDDRNSAMINLLQELRSVDPKDYNDNCSSTWEGYYQKLEDAVEPLSSAAVEDLYVNNAIVITELEKLLREEKEILCNKKEDVTLLVCDKDTEKCVCKYNGIYSDNKEKGSCTLTSGSKCDLEGIPYPCQIGEKCLFETKNVLCTSDNLLDLKNFAQVKKSCKCSAKPAQNRFSSTDLADLTRQDYQMVAALVKNIKDSPKWKVLKKGEACSWDVDRVYFQISDYIRAGLEQPYFKTRFYGEIKQLIENKDPDTDTGICDFKKSMRCDFLQLKCGCPTDGYLLEDIPSVYNATKDACLLPPGSLCHPTLTEWISCQDGERCLYKEISVLCSRANQRKIVKEKMRLKSARCTCSSIVPQEINTKLIKRFQKRERTEF